MKRLAFGIGPIARSPSHDGSRLVFVDLLAEEIGSEVVMVVATSYQELIGLVSRDEVALAWLPPAVYVRCRERSDVSLLLGACRSDGMHFSGALFVKADSPWTSAADLAGADVRVAWVDRDSCAGYLYPRLALEDRGLPADSLFSGQFMMGSHQAVARAVEVGQVDVGATFVQGGPDPLEEPGEVGWSLEVDRAQMRTILLSAPIPADVICASPSLDPGRRAAATRALMSLHETEEGARALRALFGVERFLAACDEDYELVRRAMAALEST